MQDPIWKITKAKKSGHVTQILEHLSSKHEEKKEEKTQKIHLQLAEMIK
jgi:hypothetical protein